MNKIEQFNILYKVETVINTNEQETGFRNDITSYCLPFMNVGVSMRCSKQSHSVNLISHPVPSY